MSAIDHLNRIMEAAAGLGRNVPPDEAIRRSVLVTSTMTDQMERSNHRMLAGASTLGNIRVAYEVPIDLYKELQASKIDPEDIPTELIVIPHPRIFLRAFDQETKKGFFYFLAMDHFDGFRVLTVFMPTGSLPVKLIPGLSVADSIRKTEFQIGPFRGDGSYTPEGKMFEMLETVVKVALFLSATNDYEDVDVPPIGGGKKNRNKPDFMKQPATRRIIGGKFVSALNRYRKTRSTGAATSITHGDTKPHLRAGHWHLYWTGKGSKTGTGPKIPKVQWLHPCLVNADEVGEVEIQRTIKN